MLQSAARVNMRRSEEAEADSGTENAEDTPASQEQEEGEAEGKSSRGRQKKKKRKRHRKKSKRKEGDSDDTEEQSQGTGGSKRPRNRKVVGSEGSSSNLGKQEARHITAQVTERWDTLKVLEAAEGFSILKRPEWLTPTIEAATYVVDDDGNPEVLPVGANLRCLDELVLAGIIEQFSSMSLEQIHHFALNGEFMYGLFREKKLVDLLIHIGDRIFYGHRNILCTHSGFFASILVDNDVPPYKVTDVTLENVDPDMFKLFLHFAYTGDIFVTSSNLRQLKDISSALQSSTLRARLLLYMSKMALLTLPEALHLLCNHKQVDETPLAIEVVKHNFKKVLEDVDSLGRFSVDDFHDIISASNVCVNSELDIFWAVLFWVATDPKNRINYLKRLMSEVRFTNMSSLELLDCARVSSLVKMSKPCTKLLINANWVCHARELGLEDPLRLPMQPKRQCLYQMPAHEPTVAEFDHRFLIYTMLMEQHKDDFYLDPDTERPGVTFENSQDVANFVYFTEEVKGSPQARLSEDSSSDVAGSTETDTYEKEPQHEGTSKGTENVQTGFNKSTAKDSEETPSTSQSESNENNDTTEQPTEQQPCSEGNDLFNNDLSSNAPYFSHEQSSPETLVDPLLLWESNVLPSRTIILSGAPILQPIKLQKLTLNRAAADTRGMKLKATDNAEIKQAEATTTTVRKSGSGVVKADKESAASSTHSAGVSSSVVRDSRGIWESERQEQHDRSPEVIHHAKKDSSKSLHVQPPQTAEPSTDLMTFD